MALLCNMTFTAFMGIPKKNPMEIQNFALRKPDAQKKRV